MQFLRKAIYHLFSLFAVLANILLFASSAFSQLPPDSTLQDSSFLSSFNESSFLRDTIELSEPVSFELTQRYQLQQGGFPYLRIGNVGHALYSPLVTELTKPIDFTSSIMGVFSPYFDQRDNIMYYRNRPPFTVLSYHSGAKKEEGIEVIHARNFGKNLNISLHLDRNSSEGFYNNLSTRAAIFNTNINYSTANHRYMLLTHYYVNRKEVDENGGYDDFNSIIDPETINSSRLDQASNDAKDEGFYISQSIGIGNTAEKKDVLIKPLFRIGHDLQLRTGYRRYQDLGGTGGLDSSYSNIYYDSTLTRDTLSYQRMSNQINLYFYPGEERVLFYYLNDFIDYRQNQFLDTTYTDHHVGTEFSLYYFDKTYKSDITADYVFDGFRKGDLSLSADLHKRKVDTLNLPSIEGKFYYDLRNPQFKHLIYNSNNFIWSNDFNKVERWGLNAGVSYKGYTLSGDFGSINNVIYYDQNALPDQFDQRISYISASLGKQLNWNNFHLNNRIVFQNTSNDIIPVSNLLFNESVYFQNFLFKKALLFRVGFDLFYFTGYNALAYQPALGEFHLQDKQTIGNYPFIDFYITFKLKKAFFFIKMEHINKGMAGDNFYNVPDYPVPPRAFKWGIKWTLFD